jgi:transcriptional regulator with XRE-family HTH domain
LTDGISVFTRFVGSCFGSSRLSTRNNARASFSNRSNAEPSVRSWGQERLAEAANLTADYIGFVERGENVPTLTVNLKLARALNVDAGDLPRGVHSAIVEAHEVVGSSGQAGFVTLGLALALGVCFFLIGNFLVGEGERPGGWMKIPVTFDAVQIAKHIVVDDIYSYKQVCRPGVNVFNPSGTKPAIKFREAHVNRHPGSEHCRYFHHGHLLVPLWVHRFSDHSAVHKHRFGASTPVVFQRNDAKCMTSDVLTSVSPLKWICIAIHDKFYRLNQYISPFQRFERTLRGVGGQLRGGCQLAHIDAGSFHLTKLLLHQPSLHVHQRGLLPHSAPLAVREYRESQREKRYGSSVRESPPIARRFAIALLTGLSLIPYCYTGASLADGGRVAVGRAVIVSSFTLVGASLLLYFLTGFECSWG